jgi:hypothetical protein
MGRRSCFSTAGVGRSPRGGSRSSQTGSRCRNRANGSRTHGRQRRSSIPLPRHGRGHGRTHASVGDRAWRCRRLQRRRIIGLDMAIHHPARVTKLAVTGANSRTSGYTAENLEWVRSFDPDAAPVSDAYARLSPNGAEHWPILLRRLKPMWMAEPSFTREQLQSIEAPP